ncbi:MAG: hypothetical protein PVF56_04425 [Desulfobacterales bacterium]|jgi:hypothetical protein
MNASNSGQQAQDVSLLSILMKIQIIAFLIYGITFFFIPAWTLQAIFAFDQLPPLTWPRAVGGMFLAIALAEYLCDRRLSERLDLAWFFSIIPGFLLVSFIWDRVAGAYQGSELFYWVSVVVTAFFFVAIGGSRLKIRTQ